MMTKLDKQTCALLFRTRLLQTLDASGTSQSALARAIGADRSTLSQALSTTGTRLPGAHIVANCAKVLGVSADWLLGLSDRRETAADLLSASVTLSQAERAMVDEQIYDWHREAAGYKIRHVPAFLPDMLKTPEVLEWEYGPHLGRTTKQAIEAAQSRLNWMRSSQSDYEMVMPLYEISSFAAGTGYYQHLPRALRSAQLDHMRTLTEQLYPRLRVYLYDARRLFAAPITIFGPLIAVLYTGGHYLAFRDRARVDTYTTDFDHLVREATVAARAFPQHLDALRPRLGRA